MVEQVHVQGTDGAASHGADEECRRKDAPSAPAGYENTVEAILSKQSGTRIVNASLPASVSASVA